MNDLEDNDSIDADFVALISKIFLISRWRGKKHKLAAAAKYLEFTVHHPVRCMMSVPLSGVLTVASFLKEVRGSLHAAICACRGRDFLRSD